jgi:uncharacterized protein (DUF697 family)
LKNKLGYKELHKIAKDARRDADRQLEVVVVGERADTESLNAFFGPGANRTFKYVHEEGLQWAGENVDLVILALGAKDPIGPRLKRAAAECRALGLEVLALSDQSELAEAALGAKKVEAEIAFDLSPGRVRFFSSTMDPEEKNRILRYMLERVKEKELPLAAGVPIFRPLVANAIIESVANTNGVIGLVNFFPGADMPVLTANQMRMVLKMAVAYDVPLTLQRARELLAVLGGGFTFRALARQAAGLVPVAGWAVKGAVAYSGTRTVGTLARLYFESLNESN